MGWDFYREEYVKTRKIHKCEFCDRIIPIGSNNILHWAGKFEGNFQSSYSCHWCEDHIDNFTIDDYICDFWSIIKEDIFFKKIDKLKEKYINLKMELEEDYLIFYDSNKIIIHKEYIPIIRKDNK